MQTKPDAWSIVLAGYWNRMIFTPEWVAPRLFEENDQIETLVTLLPILPIIYRDKQIAVEIASNRIVCRARNIEEETALRRSGTVAGIILGALPETPVQGLGINFAFREASPVGHLLDLFDFTDNARLAEAGWEIGERKIVRRLIRETDTLNLTLTLANGELDIECNFHTDVDDRNAAVAAVAPDRIIQLRDTAIAMLNEQYGLVTEKDNGEA